MSDTVLKHAGLPPEVEIPLLRAGIVTVEELREHTHGDLVARFGPHAAAIIASQLARRGLGPLRT